MSITDAVVVFVPETIVLRIRKVDVKDTGWQKE